MSRDSMPSTAPKNPEVYRILRLLGEGGMGARRKIALKVIKAVCGLAKNFSAALGWRHRHRRPDACITRVLLR